MRLLCPRSLVPLSVAAATVVPAFAQGGYSLSVVHVNTPGHPTNVVPGLGVPFKAGNTTTDGSAAFERPHASGDGLHFGINVLAAVGGAVTTSNDDILLVDGAIAVREGDVCPWPAGAETVGPIDSNFGLNSSGSLLLGNNSSAVSTADDYVALRVGGVWNVLAKEAVPVSTVVAGLVGDGAGTATWNDTMESCRLDDVGTAIWRADLLTGISTGIANDEILVIGATALQEGVAVPSGQAGGATNAWDNFDVEDVFVSPSGFVVAIQGDLLGATTSDDVLVVNGTVVIQEGSILAGSSFTEPVDQDGIVKAWVDRGDNWYARGNNDVTEDDWVVRNGIVVARSDGTDPVLPGGTEVWSDGVFTDCFFAFDGNHLGHYVIAGVTNAAATSDGVIVFDDGFGNRHVVVREGEPVDLDDNGLFDDDRFWNTFGNDDVLLLDDGSVIFTATLRTAAGTVVDQGLFKLVPTLASCTFRNGTGINPIACSCVTLPVVGTTFQVAVTPGPQTLGTLLLADFIPIPPFPIFGGELLIAPAPFIVPNNIAIPYGWQGLAFSLQGVRIDTNGVDLLIVLTNAQDAVVGH